MGQSEAHCHQGHGGGDVSQIGYGCLQIVGQMDLQQDHGQSRRAEQGSGIYHGLQGGQRELSVQQGHSIGVEHDGIDQQKLRDIDHIFLSQNASHRGDPYEAQIGEDKHHLENLALVRGLVEEGRQKHPCQNEYGKHPYGDEGDEAHGAQRDHSHGTGGAG